MVFCIPKESIHPWLSKAPGTSVKRLLLGPDNFLQIRVLVKGIPQLSIWEGVKLLDTGDGNVINIVGSTVLVEGSVDLTRTDKHAGAILWRLDSVAVFWVWYDPFEVSLVAEVFKVGASKRMTEESLREEEDECYNAVISIGKIEYYFRKDTYAFGTACAFASSRCGTSWQARSYKQPACCSLDVVGRALEVMGIYEDPHYKAARIVLSYQKSALVLVHRSREEEKG